MLNKSFDPKDAEPRLYKLWEEANAFRAGQRPEADTFCIMIPPPNVTGSLHMGHALNNTLQDVLVRFERMRGKDVLWQPGTDHAGIATQMVVERQLAAEGNASRRDLGREAFVTRVWQWKEESGGTILNQLRRLGASCDWSRLRFTMDEGLSRAVIKVFVSLYNEGLIYRDKRLVNWDPKLLTAISDLEVEQVEVKGHMWHFKYPLEDDASSHITVATTRPETMLGDTAVAVHPEDARYAELIGKNVILPLVGRRLPIVADDYADPEQGSGAVKITPAHDFNDFEVGRRHNLEAINIFDATAALNDQVPEPYRGLDRFEARRRIVEDMEGLGLVEKIEPHVHAVPYGDRSHEVIEPWLTDQWYVDAATLAAPAIAAVENGDMAFVPQNWERTYFEWMRNIQPWCISRQLWWGHRIPAWFGPDGRAFVAETEGDARALATAHYGESVELTQDEDVLDTWFSSALWPFSTLGWPDQTPELERFYKTDVLVTAFDIIFFWVARMMMMGLHFMKEVPFRTTYIHALVRDEKGQKMSKSKGNIIDPLVLIEKYGADALRFTLAAMAAQGRDIRLSESRVEGYRNFGTKIWNAARFCEMNGCVMSSLQDPMDDVKHPVNQWILNELSGSVEAVSSGIETFRFNEAAGAAYQFVWHIYCDWYLELAKPLLMSGNSNVEAETRATAGWVLQQVLHLLHPFMPFLTEELWQELNNGDQASVMCLALSTWPTQRSSADFDKSGQEIRWVIQLITEIRSIRAELNVPAGAKIDLVIKDASPVTKHRLAAHGQTIERLARLKTIAISDAIPKGSIQSLLDEATLALPLADVIDMDQERARLQKEVARLEKDMQKITAKLSNQQFLSKAPDEVVEEQRQRLADAENSKKRLTAALARLMGT